MYLVRDILMPAAILGRWSVFTAEHSAKLRVASGMFSRPVWHIFLVVAWHCCYTVGLSTHSILFLVSSLSFSFNFNNQMSMIGNLTIIRGMRWEFCCPFASFSMLQLQIHWAQPSADTLQLVPRDQDACQQQLQHVCFRSCTYYSRSLHMIITIYVAICILGWLKCKFISMWILFRILSVPSRQAGSKSASGVAILWQLEDSVSQDKRVCQHWRKVPDCCAHEGTGRTKHTRYCMWVR